MNNQLTGAKRYRELVRSEEELALMRQSGLITAQALKKTIDAVCEGISLKELDQTAEVEIKRLGGEPSFKTVPGYFWTTCLNINDEVVHGIPRDIKLKKGDLISIDLGAIYKGWHTDASWSSVVGGNESKDQEIFLETGKRSLAVAVKEAVEGKQIGDISSAMQTVIEKAGYSVVKSLCGHGVGRELHEEPEVPGYGKTGTGFKLKAGMTLAIEAIYTAGNGRVYESSDGWTIVSADQSMAGLFEVTVIVGKNKPEIITRIPE